MRIVMLGAPGCGKGTQTKLLTEKYSAEHLSTGDLLRAAVAAETPAGLKAKAAMESGGLVSDEIVLELIRDRLTGDAAVENFILDGFPRNLAQAEALEQILEAVGQPLMGVVLIDVPTSELTQRIAGRRICRDCGAIFNVHFSPTQTEGVCDQCGGETYQRSDDNETTVASRLGTYAEQTEPLIDFYAQRHLLTKVAGNAPMDTVFAEVCGVIDGFSAG
ncbi:MAG: adenylate kinase [Gammaproteobacteria bacterium]